MRGFFLPLSGGIDSCSTALIVSSMCRLVYKKIVENDSNVRKDVLKITGVEPKSVMDLTNQLFCTCYMASRNSSLATRKRALDLANAIGSHHIEADISGIYDAFVNEFVRISSGKAPKFKSHGGTDTENLALQNIQARSRMVLGYLMAQLIPWNRGNSGGLLVLGSANVDEWYSLFFFQFEFKQPLISIYEVCEGISQNMTVPALI